MSHALLVVNLGTPQSPAVRDVRRYLRQFLMDPYVITLPYVLRFLLVHTIIAPFRGPKSAQAYQRIWTSSGSPLRVNTQRLTKKLQQQLATNGVRVAFAMRYGEPSIGQVVEQLKMDGVKTLYALPLYPQFADSSTQTALDQIHHHTAKHVIKVTVRKHFFDDPDFIAALAASTRSVSESFSPEHTVFSFHGLPQAHILSKDKQCAGCLLDMHCSRRAVTHCYRAQCFETADRVATALALDSHAYSVAFQSRLGRMPWIKPYTDEHIRALAHSGVKRLQVVCAAFTADCLETLEEIGMESRDMFLSEGGEAFQLTPCLNDDDGWAAAIVHWVRQWQQQM